MKGIVVAADQTQEWLLPWWWSHYALHNSYPVTFVDLGLSEEKKKWCEQRGKRVALRLALFPEEKEAIASELVEQWEEDTGSLWWNSREAWFKKPFACLESPYDLSIWIDLDCEIRGSLESLFAYADHLSGMALRKEEGPGNIYNSGVIVFKKGFPLLEQWAQQALIRTAEFRGDQELLSALIAEQNLLVTELPDVYNWSRCKGDSEEAIIYHWHGEFGKSVIRHQMGSPH